MAKNDDSVNNDGRENGPLTRDSQVTDHLNTVFDILREPHRRYLLYYLYHVEDAVVSVEDAVEAVQRYEAAGTETDETPATQPVRLGLLHTHLPKLVSEEVIDYDSERGKIRFWGHKPLDEWIHHARYLEFEQ